MWVLGLLACEGEPTRAKTRVQGQDSTPPAHSATGSTPPEPHNAVEVVHTGGPALHTGEPCGVTGALGWQVTEWVEETVTDLAYSTPGLPGGVGRLLVPIGETLDVCAATCSEPWAVPIVSRPGRDCSDPPASLPLLDVGDGEVVRVCVAVYDPGADGVATCEVVAGGWSRSFDVIAYAAR